jgi:hypothetical protein
MQKFALSEEEGAQTGASVAIEAGKFAGVSLIAREASPMLSRRLKTVDLMPSSWDI